jgi:hypothetical protein
LANHLHIVHLSRCYLGQPSIFRRFLLSPFGIEVVRAAEPRDFSRNLLVQRVWEGEAGEARGEEDEQLEKVPVACKAARAAPAEKDGAVRVRQRETVRGFGEFRGVRDRTAEIIAGVGGRSGRQLGAGTRAHCRTAPAPVSSPHSQRTKPLV